MSLQEHYQLVALKDLRTDADRRSRAIEEANSLARAGSLEFVNLVLGWVMDRTDLVRPLIKARTNHRRLWDICDMLSAPVTGFALPWSSGPIDGCSPVLYQRLRDDLEDATEALERSIHEISTACEAANAHR